MRHKFIGFTVWILAVLGALIGGIARADDGPDLDAPITFGQFFAAEGDALRAAWGTSQPSLDVEVLYQRIFDEAAVYAGNRPLTARLISEYMNDWAHTRSDELEKDAAKALNELLDGSANGGADDSKLSVAAALLATLSQVTGKCTEDADGPRTCALTATRSPNLATPSMYVARADGGAEATDAPLMPNAALAALPQVASGTTLFYAVDSQQTTCGQRLGPSQVIKLPTGVALPGTGTDVTVSYGSAQRSASNYQYTSNSPCYPGTVRLYGDVFTGILVNIGRTRDIIQVHVPYGFECPSIYGSACKDDLVACYLGMKWFGADFQQCITQFAFHKVNIQVHGDTNLASGQVVNCLVAPAAGPEARPGFIFSEPALKSKGLNYGMHYQATPTTGGLAVNMYPAPSVLRLLPAGDAKGLYGGYYMLISNSWQPNVYYVAQDSANVFQCSKWVTPPLAHAQYVLGDSFFFAEAVPSYDAVFNGAPGIFIAFGVGFKVN